MDQKRLSDFKQRLLQMQEDIRAIEATSKEATKIVELDQTRVGRLSRMDAMQGQQMAKESERRRQHQLTMINAALKRIEMDDYGYCVRCDEEIDIRRLDLDPALPCCINCAQQAKTL